jgi:hypothetical protein
MAISYCLRFETPPNLEGQVPVFISPGNREAQAKGSLFVASYDSQGYGRDIRAHLYARSSIPGVLYVIYKNENWQGKPKYAEETCPSAILFTTNVT